MKINHIYLQSPFEKPALIKNCAFLERYTTFPNTENEKFWYLVLKRDNFKEITFYSASVRRQIRAGLRRNKIKLIDKNKISLPLFKEIFKFIVSVFRRYDQKGNKYFRFSENNLNSLIEESDYIFIAKSSKDKQISGIIFLKKIKDGIFMSEAFFSKNGLRNYVSYSLFYSIISFSKEQKNIKYITNGTLNLEHITEVHDFLIRNFEFTKVFVDLHIRISLSFLLLFYLMKYIPFLRFNKYINLKYKALHKLFSYKKSFQVKLI